MAKLKSPLHSLTARGTIAGFLTFSQRASGSQARWQKKQKDIITAPRISQRDKFLVAKNMWPLSEVGIAECGYVLFGGQYVAISDLPKDQRAPQFARFVSDVISFYC